MATGTGTVANIEIGPGSLHVAPIGTTEPTSASAALPSAWIPIGYTEDGNAFTYEVTNEGILVAEEFDPVLYMTTGRNGSVVFQMAEATRANLGLALNAGVIANNAVALEPPAPGAEVRVMLVLDTADDSRWIFRQAFQGGAVEIANRKAPQKKLIAVTFRLEKPTGLQPFKVFPNASGKV